MLHPNWELAYETSQPPWKQIGALEEIKPEEHQSIHLVTKRSQSQCFMAPATTANCGVFGMVLETTDTNSLLLVVKELTV